MQLPDEALEYDYRGALAPTPDGWTPLAELQAQQLLATARLRSLVPMVTHVRGQVAAERELQTPTPKQHPLPPGFIDLPQKLLDQHRRKGEASELGRVMTLAARLREQVDRVVMLGAGAPYYGARALFEALCHAHHNELPPRTRLGKPRLYFEGNTVDNDAAQDLVELLENTCVDPELHEERWGVIVIGAGDAIETAAAYRLFRSEAARYYGPHSPRMRKLIVPVAGANDR